MLKNTRMLVILAMFVAIQIVMVRFLRIETPILRISFVFLPIAISGILYGPKVAGITAMIANVVGVLLFPPPTGPFWGFTLSYFLIGVNYGFFLHNNGRSMTRIVLAVAVHLAVIAMILNTYWLTIITGGPFWGIFPTRLIGQMILFPLQITMIYTTWRLLEPFLKSRETYAG